MPSPVHKVSVDHLANCMLHHAEEFGKQTRSVALCSVLQLGAISRAIVRGPLGAAVPGTHLSIACDVAHTSHRVPSQQTLHAPQVAVLGAWQTRGSVSRAGALAQLPSS